MFMVVYRYSFITYTGVMTQLCAVVFSVLNMLRQGV